MGAVHSRPVPSAGVPFFFKQWGGVRKSKTGRELDGRTYDEYPDIVPNAVPSPSSRADLLAKTGPRLARQRKRHLR